MRIKPGTSGDVSAGRVTRGMTLATRHSRVRWNIHCFNASVSFLRSSQANQKSWMPHQKFVGNGNWSKHDQLDVRETLPGASLGTVLLPPFQSFSSSFQLLSHEVDKRDTVNWPRTDWLMRRTAQGYTEGWSCAFHGACLALRLSATS